MFFQTYTEIYLKVLLFIAYFKCFNDSLLHFLFSKHKILFPVEAFRDLSLTMTCNIIITYRTQEVVNIMLSIITGLGLLDHIYDIPMLQIIEEISARSGKSVYFYSLSGLLSVDD